jgi:signal transduction histidine kinase
MPKLVTVLRPEKIDEQARNYVRSHILLPAGTIGLVCMVGGVGSLGYQLLVNHTYSWVTFLTSSVLLVVGALCGWGQARYHRYLFTAFPEVYAAKMRTAVAQRNRKARAEPEVPAIEHPGRAFVTAISIAGAAMIFGSSAVAIIYGELDLIPAVFVPWAAFYWAKLFSWRGVVD